MVNSKYKIDPYEYTHHDQGGYCAFYRIFNSKNLAFKEFISKSKAEYARKIQLKLSKYNLAPKICSKLCKVKYEKIFPGQKSGWGYITEIVKIVEKNSVSLSKVQKLVDNIYDKTKLKFWDCHWDNIGYIRVGDKKQLVCIDTGKETWEGHSNYFGNTDPGPKCAYCLKYRCECTGE